MSDQMSDKLYEHAVCEECGREDLVDVRDLEQYTQADVDERAGFVITETGAVCPDCWEFDPS